MSLESMGTDGVEPLARSSTGPSPAIIGVLGGMGPSATADFFTKLIAATPANSDQEHRHVVIWSDPSLPDRSEALLGRGPDPTPWLVRGAQALKESGATVIAIPCNTAHAFVPYLTTVVGVRVIHMIDEVISSISCARPALREVGLMATTGTIRSNLYQERLRAVGIVPIIPSDRDQEQYVMPAIRAIKGGHLTPELKANLVAVGDSLVNRGTDRIIAGCTELPIALLDSSLSARIIDPARILAESTIRQTASRSERTSRAQAILLSA